MADIKPFRGVFYNQEVVGDLSAVVAPPYDVISPEDEEYYRHAHPNNVIRLILPTEDSIGDKYYNAAEILRKWLATGVLVRDNQDCLYLCVQEFIFRGEWKRRFGFTCLVRLEEFGSGKVRPHENTLPKPLEDRLNLMRATRSNFDSVFGLYAGRTIPEMLVSFVAAPPDASTTDRDGAWCHVWRMSDSHVIQNVAEAIRDEPLIIADGHHRYSAALAYRDEMRAIHGAHDPEAPWEYVMMTLVSFDDPGLVVLPTHRLVRNIADFSPARITAQIGEFFELKETPAAQLEKEVASANGTRATFGLYLGNGISYVMRLKPTIAPENMVEIPGSDALKRLDVSVLHGLILDKLLGIGAQQVASGNNVGFTRDVETAMHCVDNGEYQMLLVMNPTKVDQIMTVTSMGDRLPQKSTFFYPKLLTGLVMRVMD